MAELSDTEKEKLEEVRKIAPELMKMYEQKEKLREIFDSKIRRDEAFDKMVEWTESSHKYFPKSCQTIKLGNYSRKNILYKAFQELGRVMLKPLP